MSTWSKMENEDSARVEADRKVTMDDRDEITLCVDLPDVVETPYRVHVWCGATAVYVHEHGVQGSGTWMVWTGGGSRAIGETHDCYSTMERAVSAARKYVRDVERSRRLHADLRAALLLRQGSLDGH